MDVVGRLPEGVAHGIDAESRMIEERDPGTHGEEKRAPEVTQQIPQKSWNYNPREYRPRDVILVLVPHHLTLCEIFHVFVRHMMLPKKKPSDMRVKEPFLDTVGIKVGIDIAVMLAVLGSPLEG